MINVHHMYNKDTIPILHEVGPTVCGAHSMWEGCCTCTCNIRKSPRYIILDVDMQRMESLWQVFTWQHVMAGASKDKRDNLVTSFLGNFFFFFFYGKFLVLQLCICSFCCLLGRWVGGVTRGRVETLKSNFKPISHAC